MIGQLNIQKGEDVSGPYIRVQCGNFVDIWRNSPYGWYNWERRVEPLPRCQVSDKEALRELNTFSPGTS